MDKNKSILLLFIVLLILFVFCLMITKIAGSGVGRKQNIIDPTYYDITLSTDPSEDMRISLNDKYNTIYPSILEYPQIIAQKHQTVIGADRPLEHIIVGVSPKKDIWKGEIQVIRYDYVSGEELERKIYKSYGYIGTRVTQFICPNDNTSLNYSAAVKACDEPTYFAFDPARQIKPIIEMDLEVTPSNINDREYEANLVENYNYSDVKPKDLFTRRQYEKLNDRNWSSYSRVALSPKASLELNKTEWYDSNPFQRTSFEGPIYNISLLNNIGIENSGTDGIIRVTLYNQLTGTLIAGPVTFNTTGMLSFGQEGKETINVKGMGDEAIPLKFVIVGITNYDTSAWAGEVVVQSGKSILRYQSFETEIGTSKGEFVNEYRCYDGSIYNNLDDAITRCGLHRTPMDQYLVKQFYVNTSPWDSY